jgi:hypothetical protein
MIDPGFENIIPTPPLPPGVTSAQLASLRRKSKAAAAKAFRTHIKTELRLAQRARCCHCRRPLGLVPDTDIEHLVERAVVAHFDYAIQNLAISCSFCNGAKNDSFMALSKRIHSGDPLRPWTAPAVGVALAVGCPLPTAPADYRWVHPHFDAFSDHIVIHKGWIYEWLTGKGRRSVRGLRLNEVFNIERRLRQERLMGRRGPLSLIVGVVAELDRATAVQVIADLAQAIRSAKP